MKATYSILSLVATALLSVGFASCSDDEFGPSIFDTKEYVLDRNSYSFPLDTFVKKNFLEPYNMKFIYRMEDIGSDMQKNLVPAEYDKSVKLAVLAKYLWYDSYQKVVSEEFLKKFSPRIIHVIGSPSINASSGTETLGVAEGGLKITLYNANEFDENNLDLINEKFFKTMHHEFTHILHQNVIRPKDFDLISNGVYSSIDWNHTHDSIAACRGFVSPYAMSESTEDWTEVIANYIVKDSKTWNNLLENASYEWEQVDLEVDKWKPLDQRVNAGLASRDSVGYNVGVASSSGGDAAQYKIVRKVIARGVDGNPALDADGKMVYLDNDGIDGKAVILRKLDVCKEWLKKNFGYELEDLRNEVQKRQYLTDANGEFIFDEDGEYINALTSPSKEDPSKTLMEVLLEGVNQYKSLQNN